MFHTIAAFHQVLGAWGDPALYWYHCCQFPAYAADRWGYFYNSFNMLP
jgi:hypothetical protein